MKPYIEGQCRDYKEWISKREFSLNAHWLEYLIVMFSFKNMAMTTWLSIISVKDQNTDVKVLYQSLTFSLHI